MKRLPHQRGVTLVELVATMLVIGVLAAIALPSFLSMVRNNRAESQASLLMRALSYARSEAVRRNAEVHVSALDGTAWNSGWRIWVDRNGNNEFNDGTDDELRLQEPFTGAAVLTPDPDTIGEVVFSGSGFLQKKAGYTFGTELKFLYRVEGHCELGRDVSLLYAGRVSIKKQDC